MTALSSSDMTRVLFSMRDLTNFSPFFSVNIKRMKNYFGFQNVSNLQINQMKKQREDVILYSINQY